MKSIALACLKRSFSCNKKVKDIPHYCMMLIVPIFEPISSRIFPSLLSLRKDCYNYLRIYPKIFVGALLLLTCKGNKQPEGSNSVNIIECFNIYGANNRILSAQGTEYDYLYFGDNKDKGILAETNNFIKKYSNENDASCYTVEESLSKSLLKTMRYTENTIEELVLKNGKDTSCRRRAILSHLFVFRP
ncbi:hypothetical protein [uncultured Bacteroides sp.]|uniref:hypothetical protein n=1 Tax=uncultured Bacteroides sp. TaxID=162156 RepID=UPI0025CF6535|nr:hypothetical protein [uncultured Bacteroides sp.]